MLAGIIPSPNNWDPAVSPDKAEARWNIVLDSMEEEGWLDRRRARAAMVFPPTIDLPAPRHDGRHQRLPAGDGASTSSRRRRYELTDDELNRSGYSVVTTIQQPHAGRRPWTQVDAFQAGHARRARTAPLPDERTRVVSITSVDPKDGAIVALYGGAGLPRRPARTARRTTTIQAGLDVQAVHADRRARAGRPAHDEVQRRAPRRRSRLGPVPQGHVRNFERRAVRRRSTSSRRPRTP